MAIATSTLTPIERTAFLTEYARALDSRQPRPILGDTLADDVVGKIEYDFAGLGVQTSVILQTARRAKSDEVRTSLRDAHNRVMSVAAVQKHLAASTLGDVEVRPYLTKLCQSIGASMIRDPKQLSLKVFADEGEVSADASVSMGLITTELVINALKHAFPGNKRGTITVAYHSSGPNWSLSVSDNGVGMPADPESIKPGLGTNIVQALAKQLDAHIQFAANAPGTKVSIVHAQLSIVDDEPEDVAARPSTI